jgi:ABC-type glycerol-3-phosphate transport system substrate-binding protein
MRSYRLFLLPILTVIFIVGAISPLLGQSETIVTIGVPGWMTDVFRDDLFDPFEAQHPGVKVVVVPAGDDVYYPSAGWNIEEHLDGAQKYASYADVVYATGYNLSVEATRSGYFLDLAPLINSDPTFDTNDFFPKIWQSVQWDGGIWYIPASASVQLLLYDANAFDDAGLTYPDANWTLDNLVTAARALTVYDADGDVDVPGFQGYGSGMFLYSLIGQGVYDASVIPSTPKFDHPDLPALLEQWRALQKEIAPEGNFDYNKVPLMLNSPWQLINPMPDSEQKWAASLLPGGMAGLDVQGFAVSGGTQNPELAYALAVFTSSSPEVVNRFFGNTPARRSLVGVEAEDSPFIASEVPEEVQTLIDQAVENAIPTSELRYQDYIDTALNGGTEGTEVVDIPAALQQAEVDALKALETAAARRTTATVYVSTPVPTPSFGADQIVLRFGLSLFSSEIPQRDEWDRLIQEFLVINPSVGNIDIQTQFYEQADLDKLDCYYQPYNMVPSMTQSDFLNLDPFMDADPAFDRNDFIGTVLTQVQRDNQTWAYPIVVQPSILWYDSDLFSKAGVVSPEQGWTVDGFRDALEMVRSSLDDADDPVFAPNSFGNNYLLLLMAAYGGIPYDYRTTPPTINFTDPTTVEAIRQVLDLAKDGYIAYQKLSGNGGMIGGSNTPIVDDTLSTSSWRFQNRSNPDFQDSYRLANFPRGNQLIPVAYGVGAAYIQDHAQNPEACYNWIATIAQRPDLFGGMPARLSQINDPTIMAAQGEDVTALYQGFVETFENPNTIAFPGQYGGSSSFSDYVEPMWLNKAFDHYVLEEGNLETDLAEAETLSNAYRECASVIPEIDPSQLTTPEESTAYYRQFTDCAVTVDPSMKETFSYYYEEE